MILVLFITLAVVNFRSIRILFSRTASPSPIDDTPVTRKVFLLVFNPIIESQGSVKLTNLKNWSDPDTLTYTVIDTVPRVSGNYLSYLIAERAEVDGIFIKPDGFQYTDQSYLDCVEGRSDCHSPDIINYQQLFSTYNICSKNVDEVWLWGGPYFGYLEYNPVRYCGKTMFVMGFNYERTIGEALHDFGHRMEFIGLSRIGNGTWRQNETNEWNKYSFISRHCGNIHYPPGTIVGSEEYKYDKTTPVSTDCDGYLTYPSGPYTPQMITCSVWGCSQEGYVRWWLTDVPHNKGTSVSPINGKVLYNNWWKYYVYFDEF